MHVAILLTANDKCGMCGLDCCSDSDCVGMCTKCSKLRLDTIVFFCVSLLWNIIDWTDIQYKILYCVIPPTANSKCTACGKSCKSASDCGDECPSCSELCCQSW